MKENRPRIHTHYDNLKVARNAPLEVIRAAYKVLVQKHHPDRRENDADASRITAIIKSSYEALSDPESRRRHDEWIAQQEALLSIHRQNAPPSAHAHDPSRSNNAFMPSRLDSLVRFLKRSARVVLYSFWLSVMGFVVYLIINEEGVPSKRSDLPKQSQKSGPRSIYSRPDKAPNGQQWPVFAGYIKGYERFMDDGLSTVEIDNTRNSSDVFVKLYFLAQDGSGSPVRHFFIPGNSRFKLINVSEGRYDIRYKDLDDGSLSRSESFVLREIETQDGVQYSTMTMTLYKVSNGNMKTFRLNEDQF